MTDKKVGGTPTAGNTKVAGFALAKAIARPLRRHARTNQATSQPTSVKKDFHPKASNNS